MELANSVNVNRQIELLQKEIQNLFEAKRDIPTVAAQAQSLKVEGEKIAGKINPNGPVDEETQQEFLAWQTKVQGFIGQYPAVPLALNDFSPEAREVAKQFGRDTVEAMTDVYAK
jgi:FtsZ-binding cell division protein ZapB